MKLASSYCKALKFSQQQLCDSMHEALGKPWVDSGCANIALDLHNQLFRFVEEYRLRSARAPHRNAWARQLSSAEVKLDLTPIYGGVHAHSFWLSMGTLRDLLNGRVLHAVGL